MIMVFMLKTLRPLGAVAAGLALLLVSACGGTGEKAGAQPGQLDVVVAFYPFRFVAERVAGDHAAVTSLTSPGTEPHDVELNPKQVATVTDADFVLYESGFQAAVDEAVAQSDNEAVLDTTSVVPLQKTGAGHDHGEEHDGEEGDHDHEHGEADPHVWLDPENMATIATAVAEQLATVDPDNADVYTANAKGLATELGTLDEEFSTGLAQCERREFVVTHAAFGYLAQRYDLEQVSIGGLSPDAEPSPARIAEIHEEVAEHDITTIFSETLVSPAVAESIAADLGLETDVLDPIEGLTDQSRGDDYLSVMRANLEALQKAGSCT